MLGAYESNESGSIEVFVPRFPDGGDKQQISPGGGLRPFWRLDGKDLFYITPDSDLMAVGLSSNSTLSVLGGERRFRTPGGQRDPQPAVAADRAAITDA